MSIGVHDFEIPHEHVQPTRDIVIIRIPLPPKFVGDSVKIEVPDMLRDLAQHNVQAGRIVKMGPLAFTYKNGEGGLSRQDVLVGDWVVIRPFAGTLMQGGKIQVNSGWRYVSSFQDVQAIIPAQYMPDPETLIWTETDPRFQTPTKSIYETAKKELPADIGVRERVTYPGKRERV